MIEGERGPDGHTKLCRLRHGGSECSCHRMKDNKVLSFKSRRPITPEGTATCWPQGAEAPADGLVLACSCGNTSMELLNAGVVRCARCGASGKVYWAKVPKEQ